METLLVLFGGLVARLLIFVLLFTVFATPIAVAVLLSQGAIVLHQRFAGTVNAGGAHWKPGLTYTEAHTWVKERWHGRVKVGLDDVAGRILSGTSAITLPAIGTKLRRGDAMARVWCADRQVPIPSPVSGVVLERNRSLMLHPAMLEHDPYGDGWMLHVESREPDEAHGRRGAASRAWLRDENLRLNRVLESSLGIAAADGGTLMAAPARLLSDAAWREATREFLEQAQRL